MMHGQQNVKMYECICRCLYDIVILVHGCEQDKFYENDNQTNEQRRVHLSCTQNPLAAMHDYVRPV